jgi:N-ATPase, AtpR subunit
MTATFAPDHAVAMHLLGAGAWIVLGLLIGAIHFLTLRWNARAWLGGQAAALAIVVHLARFALTAGALVIVARYSGALALLIVTVGILAARSVVIRTGVPG